MKNIHLIMPFLRHENKGKLIEAYRPMNVILYPIMFQNEVCEFPSESWIRPVIINMDSKDCKVMMPGCFKRNWFLNSIEIINDDYYVTVDDDDMYEANVFDEIRKMDDDIVIISMKRGYQIPRDTPQIRWYPTTTLIASPENIRVGEISAQQSFVKGKIFKGHFFNEEYHCWDGEMAIHHKEDDEQIAYRPDLFALFNFYEPGRWEKGLQVSFGVMVNDPLRLDMVLKQSQIPRSIKCHTLHDPESATKGLNKLLGICEEDGADVAVLTHQDVFFRRGWLSQMKEQISKLPENWLCAGVIGKDMQGLICGKFQDMRIPLDFDTSHIHEFPHPACCFDEAVIIVNLKCGFRFEETFEGFDLYGTLIVLQAWESGKSAWIIDARCEHYCMRPFTWYPSDLFIENYKMLYDKYKNIRVDSTALGLPPDGELIFETSAAVA